jgi:GNAT superfamily N-acetyltransferase
MAQQNSNDSSVTTNAVDGQMTRSMALNLCNWMESSVRWFGVESYSTPALWWRRPGGSGIYLGAVIIDGERPDTELFSDLNAVKDAWQSNELHLYDCWGRYDLSQWGFVQQWKNPWYLRPAAPRPASLMPGGYSIERVTTAGGLAEFEWASWVGFEEPDATPEIAFHGREAFTWHPKETVADPGMHYLVARHEGKVVAGVIAHVTEDMVGIYGLSTLPEFRRRGYARALVHAAVALRPDLPASVYPDPPSVPIYTDIGFVRAGEIAVWQG